MISIIIAVYNTEKYLDKCLESVLAQDYNDYEVILVDDGSTDLSREICDKYCAKYESFHVIHKENGGAASARNVGIDKAKGDYFVFVDSDDYIEPEMLSRLLSKIEQDERITFVNCGMRVIYEDGKQIERVSEKERIYDVNEGMIEFLKGTGEITASFADKLIRREVFDKGLRFNETIGNEDTEIVPRLIDMSERILIDNRVLYNYVKHHDSTSERKIFSLRIYGFIPALFEIKKMLKERHPNALPWFEYYMASTYNGMYVYLMDCDDRGKYWFISMKLRIKSFIKSICAYTHKQVICGKRNQLKEYIYRSVLGYLIYDKIIN